MSWRATLALIGLGAVALGATHGAAYYLGRANMATEQALEQADFNSQASDANSAVAGAVNEAGGRQGQAAAQSLQESADARRQFESRRAPPPPGYVGGDALVDPALAGDFLCRLERLRRDQATDSCGDAAEDRPERSPEDRGGL